MFSLTNNRFLQVREDIYGCSERGHEVREEVEGNSPKNILSSHYLSERSLTELSTINYQLVVEHI